MLVCCGGGGLTAGCALAFEALSPQTKIFAVEPAGYDDTRLSLEAGRPLPPGTTTNPICDALLSPRPGDVTFAGNRTRVHAGLTLPTATVKAQPPQRFRPRHAQAQPGR